MKPYLRIICFHGKYYLSVAYHPNPNRTVTLKSFGRADVESNWKAAINYLLIKLRAYYMIKMQDYISK